MEAFFRKNAVPGKAIARRLQAVVPWLHQCALAADGAVVVGFGVKECAEVWRQGRGHRRAPVGAVGLPSGSSDAAVLVWLPPGAYTVTVSGVGNTTGTALVEIYDAP